jgi:hypothetical protein
MGYGVFVRVTMGDEGQDVEDLPGLGDGLLFSIIGGGGFGRSDYRTMVKQ